jgi:hypothetical protein
MKKFINSLLLLIFLFTLSPMVAFSETTDTAQETTFQKENQRNVNIALLGTGINLANSPLKDKIIGGYDFVENKKLYKDGDEKYQRGTKMAEAILGNKADKGITPDANLLVYRIIGPNPENTNYNLINALNQAVQDNANIICLSDEFSEENPNGPIHKAIKRAQEKNIFVITPLKSEGKYESDSLATIEGVISINQFSMEQGKINLKNWDIKPTFLLQGKNELNSAILAGNMAALKIEHSDWTNERILSSLKNTLLDGKLMLETAKKIETQITPVDLSFGYISQVSNKNSLEQKVQVENFSLGDKTYGISLRLDQENPNIKLLTESTLMVKSKNTADIPIKLEINPALVQGIYTGSLILRDQDISLRVPVTIVYAPKDLVMIHHFHIKNELFTANPKNTFSNKIEFSLALKPDEVKLIATDSKKKAIPIYVTKEMEKGYHSLTWNGLDQKNQLLKDGSYQLQLVVKQGGQSFTSNSITVFMDSQEPKINITSITHQQAKKEMTISGQVSDTSLYYKKYLANVSTKNKLKLTPVKLVYQVKGSQEWIGVKINAQEKFNFKLNYKTKKPDHIILKAIDALGNESIMEVTINTK